MIGLGYAMMGAGFGPMGWFGMVFTILFWILIVGGIIMLIKMLAGEKSYCCSGKGHHSEHSPGGHSAMPGESTGLDEKNTALKILEERYARGEIEKTEFEQKKKDICG